MCRVLAADIGASSYRIVEGIASEGAVKMKELARFRHEPVWEKGHYYWDIRQMKQNLIGVIQEAARQGEEIISFGFDTFGTDFGLIDRNGALLSRPYAYRDSISDGMYQKYFQKEEECLYETIGGTYATTSSAHLLMGMKEKDKDILERAERLLFIPDLLAYLFTGNAVNECTIATSSRLLDIQNRQWNLELIRKLGLPERIFHPLSDSGTTAGPLKSEIVAGIPNLLHTTVTAVACHDTASAVVTIPKKENTSFISSGSWSVKGIVGDVPYTSKVACQYKMSNEGQPDGQYRLIRNIAGLWILEECVRNFKERGKNISIPDLALEAEQAEAFPSMIWTDAQDFAKPGNMPEKIQHFCERTEQKIPKTPVQMMQTITGGLACEYRRHNEELKMVTGEQINSLYIVGGGRRNRYLNQCAANASGCTVICGHPEATALGNLLVQLKAAGVVTSAVEYTEIASKDVPEERYDPEQRDVWEEKYEKYKGLITGGL